MIESRSKSNLSINKWKNYLKYKYSGDYEFTNY